MCIQRKSQVVLMWLDKRKILLRKLTEKEKNGGEMRTDFDKEAITKLK